LDAVYDARVAASTLGIPHYVVDFRSEFDRSVIQYFVNEYVEGKTPNPCIMCNKHIKWGALLEKARSLGASHIATGHYARIRFDDTTGRYRLFKGRYEEKDQSYALWGLTQEALAHTLFPLGELTKPEVRHMAEQLGLKNAGKQESFEICFVADNNYTRFIREQRPKLREQVQGGKVIMNGEEVGTHEGYPFYTIGQRRGLGAYGKKVYVTHIDAKTNTITIGEPKDLLHPGLKASKINLIGPRSLETGTPVQVKVRYKDRAEDGMITEVNGNSCIVRFTESKRAITPGQSAVFYQGDEVIGGGIIDHVVV